MTEAEWLKCRDPEKMLGFLRGRASERKLRLYVAGCCRRIWHLLTDDRCRRAVEVAELHADGLADDNELGRAWKGTFEAGNAAFGDDIAFHAADSCMAAVSGVEYDDLDTDAAEAVSGSAYWAARGPTARRDVPDNTAEAKAARSKARKAHAAERAAQCQLLRCIAGNVFRLVSLAPAVLTWQKGTVVRMAAVIYEERRWEDMPLLGDALEEAGVTDQAVLDHCRGPGPHARGCFVVDAILGKS